MKYKYKVCFHRGEEISLKTKVERGVAWLDNAGLHIKGLDEFTIPNSQVKTVELFRLHGLGRMIRVEHSQGRLFLTVIRFMIWQFATINFLKAGALYKELAAIAEADLSKSGAGN